MTLSVGNNSKRSIRDTVLGLTFANRTSARCLPYTVCPAEELIEDL
jgi:hypothetical protein